MRDIPAKPIMPAMMRLRPPRKMKVRDLERVEEGGEEDRRVEGPPDLRPTPVLAEPGNRLDGPRFSVEFFRSGLIKTSHCGETERMKSALTF